MVFGKHFSTVLFFTVLASTVKGLEPRLIFLAAVAADLSIEATFRGSVALHSYLGGCM